LISNLFQAGLFPILERSLDATSLRQSAISDNIANINTPNYKRKEVSFEEELKLALNKSSGGELLMSLTHPKHIPMTNSNLLTLQPQVQVDNNTLWRKDGNNVDVDVEMAELAKNTIKYQALSQRVSQEFIMLKTAIEGR